MAYRILPDTNIVSALFKGENGIADKFRSADEVIVALTVLGELYFGAEKSPRRDDYITKAEEFTVKNSVLTYDIETAKQYGIIRNALRIKGRPIPENDMWIAALARQHDLTLITRDRHFDEVEGLKIER